MLMKLGKMTDSTGWNESLQVINNINTDWDKWCEVSDYNLFNMFSGA